ncbi:Centrosomal protein of 162 kDa [Camelus dromedarius]|uniref:Centrosomal protein of 162 kDa n=1 Tax=Camelus dromedarius TaxID=9838 RepID=A0A5N4CVH9_CAMDR|nr:Centrosomal protein of 162 kDa [Camelus dromedarius]
MGNKALSAVLEQHGRLVGRNIKKEKTGLLEDLKRLKQDKQALDADLGKVKRERPSQRAGARTTGSTPSWNGYFILVTVLNLSLSDSNWII